MCVQLTADLWVDFVLPSLVVLKPDERIFKQLVQLMLQMVGADGGGTGGGRGTGQTLNPKSIDCVIMMER